MEKYKPLLDYDKLKRVCKEEPGCYCPPSHEMNQVIANTPEWVRRYFSGEKKKKRRVCVLKCCDKEPKGRSIFCSSQCRALYSLRDPMCLRDSDNRLIN
jgi:hypothetical protein